MTDFTEKINNGIEWLNENRPGWLDSIDLDSLNIESCDKCVLGQIFGEEARDTYGLRDIRHHGYGYAQFTFKIEDTEDLGFFAGWGYDIDNDILTNQWRKAITELKIRELQPA